jgi:type II secretory pathway pseudopilin PulG
MVYIIGMLAAVAIPAYNDYTAKAKLSAVVTGSQPAREALARYYQAKQRIPGSLKMAGAPSQLADGTKLSLASKGMILIASTAHGELVFTPSADDNGRISWSCSNGEGMKPTQLPAVCRDAAKE